MADVSDVVGYYGDGLAGRLLTLAVWAFIHIGVTVIGILASAFVFDLTAVFGGVTGLSLGILIHLLVASMGYMVAREAATGILEFVSFVFGRTIAILGFAIPALRVIFAGQESVALVPFLVAMFAVLVVAGILDLFLSEWIRRNVQGRGLY